MTTKRLLSFVMALAMVMSLVVFPAYATTEPLVGDLNGDNAVTTDDVVDLLLFISMPDMFPLDGFMDFDTNGDITTDDAVVLLLHISMPDMFPLPSVPTEPVETEPVVTEPSVTEPVVTEPSVTEPVVTEPAAALVLGDNAVALAAADADGETWTYTADFTGTLILTITSLKYDFDGSGELYEADAMDLEMGFGRMYAFNINGENAGVYTTSVSVTAGDTVSVGLMSYSGFATEAVITLEQAAMGGDAIISEQDITIAAGDADGETFTYTAETTGNLNIAVTALLYDWEGLGVFTELAGTDLEMGFGRMYCLSVDGVQYYQPAVDIAVTAGQTVTVNITSAFGYATQATVTFTETEAGATDPTDPSTPAEPDGSMENPFVIGELPYTVSFFGGMDQYFVYTTTEAGTITVSYLEGAILSLPNYEAWEQDENMNYLIPVEAGYELMLNLWTMEPALEGDVVIAMAGASEPTDPTDPVETDPTDPSETDPTTPSIPTVEYLVLGDNAVGLEGNDPDGETWTYTAQQDGTLTITVTALSYDWEGNGVFTEATGMDLEMGFGRMYCLSIDGEQFYTYTASVSVTAGQVVSVNLKSAFGYPTLATLTLTETEAGATEPTDPSTPAEPDGSMENPFVIGELPYTVSFFGGMDQYFVYTTTEAGTITVSYLEGTYLTLPNYEAWDQDENMNYLIPVEAGYELMLNLWTMEPALEGDVVIAMAGASEPTDPTDPVETEPVETEPVETEPVETEPVETEPVENGYIQVTSQEQLVSGQYVLIAGTGYAPGLFDNGWLTAVQPVVDGNKVTDTQGAVWTLTVGADGVSIQDSNGMFVAPKGGNNNGIINAEYFWAVSFENGTFRFAGTGEDTVVLASNVSSENKFRGYKTTTVAGYPDSYPCDFTLYVLVGEETPVEPTDPVETEPVETEPVATDPAADSLLSITEAAALGASKAHNAYTEGKYYVTGVITEIKNTTFGNMYIADGEGNTLYVYGVYASDGETRFDAMDPQPAVGDTITIYGILGQYNGTAQMKNGWVIAHTPGATEPTDPVETEPVVLPQTPAEIVAAAWGLAPGESLEGTYTLTGVISAINTPYSEQYDNVTVTIVVGDMTDMPIQCYRVKGEGADQIGKGDTITVTGSLTNYNGNIQFAQGCTLDAWEDTGAEEILPTTPEEIVNAAYALAVGEAMSGTYTLTGVITEINTAYNEQYSNVTVTIVVGDMTDKPIMCYRLKGEGADQIAVGDTITVTGALKNFYGTVEFDSGCTLDAWEAGEEESTLLTWQEYVKLSGTEQRAYKESFENSADYYAWLEDAQAAYDAEHESVIDGDIINMGDLVKNG